MKTIRYGVFETNSSSVHSLTVCTENEYEKFKNGNMLLNTMDNELYEKNEAVEISKSDFEEDKKEHYYGISDDDTWNEEYMKKRFVSYDTYVNDMEYETFAHNYTTPNGEKIIAFGYYG